MKILILNNGITFNIDAELEKVKSYFNEKTTRTLTFDKKDVTIQTSIIPYKTVNGFNKVTGKPSLVRYMGLDAAPIEACKSYVQDTQYDRVVLLWNMDSVCVPADAVVTSFTMAVPLYPHTEFIQLAVNQYLKDKGTIWIMLAHELLHADCYNANRLGIAVLDEMDATVVNGTIIPFYKNDDPYAPDGNFAHTIKNLTPFYSPKTAPVSIDLSKWGLVPLLAQKAAAFLTAAHSKGYDLKITQGFRDPAYQDKLYAQGRTMPGKIVTNASGKTSKHCQGKAFDIAFVGKDPYPKNTNWKAIGAIGKSYGLLWGGDWKTFTDLLHFEI